MGVRQAAVAGLSKCGPSFLEFDCLLPRIDENDLPGLADFFYLYRN